MAAKKKRKATATAKTKPKTKPKTKKVSPVKGMSVDEWQKKKVLGWQSDALDYIRDLVSRVAPKATLSIKWGQPVWEHNGPFAWARPAAKHVSFGFWRGADLNDPKGVLEGSGALMRHVKLQSIEDVKKLPLAAFVKEAAALNAKKGDPTKR